MLRRMPCDGPFAVTAHVSNADRIVCLNTDAERTGLTRGMGLSDSRALCPQLRTRPEQSQRDEQFREGLRRFATRYCPWVAVDGHDGLLLDISGAAHLQGGEAALADDLRLRLARAGLDISIGIADTRGGAWALARYGGGIAQVGQTERVLSDLPVAALRITNNEDTTLQRLGLKTIGQLMDLPRATLGQRFGASVLMRVDQALGVVGEAISPASDPTVYAVRVGFPEPIGLADDVMAGVDRLLPPLCDKLLREEVGARALHLLCRRVDGVDQMVELRLARAMRDAARIKPLFERGISELDAGFGIDQIRLIAHQVEPLPVQQITHHNAARADGLDDLITRMGNRIGLEHIHRHLPADSYIPERSFITAPAAWSEASGSWVTLTPRPLRIFQPEMISTTGRTPPRQFRWRRMSLTTGRATGPERIAPEWWMEDPNWRSGVRDYWCIETRQGRRLWMYHTPQNPAWFVQGEFA